MTPGTLYGGQSLDELAREPSVYREPSVRDAVSIKFAAFISIYRYYSDMSVGCSGEGGKEPIGNLASGKTGSSEIHRQSEAWSCRGCPYGSAGRQQFGQCSPHTYKRTAPIRRSVYAQPVNHHGYGVAGSWCPFPMVPCSQGLRTERQTSGRSWRWTSRAHTSWSSLGLATGIGEGISRPGPSPTCSARLPRPSGGS